MSRSRPRARRARHHAPLVHHILPLTLAAAAVAIPFVAVDSNGFSFATDLQTAATGDASVLQWMPGHIAGGLLENLTPIIGLLATAIGIGYVSKKFKLQRLTQVSKKVSLL